MGLVVYRVMRPWLYPACIFRVTPSGKEFRRCLHTLHSFTENVKTILTRKPFVYCSKTCNDFKVISARKMERLQCNEIKVSDSHANGQMEEKDNGKHKGS
jgi:hypothetical protein